MARNIARRAERTEDRVQERRDRRADRVDEEERSGQTTRCHRCDEVVWLDETNITERGNECRVCELDLETQQELMDAVHYRGSRGVAITAICLLAAVPVMWSTPGAGMAMDLATFALAVGVPAVWSASAWWHWRFLSGPSAPVDLPEDATRTMWRWGSVMAAALLVEVGVFAAMFLGA